MTIQTTTNLANAIGTRFTQKYLRAAQVRRLYDQLATPVGAPQFDLETRRGLGTTYTFNFASDMTPGTTAISQTADIVPQILRDAVSTITPTSRGEALKWSELIDLQAYTDYAAIRSEKLGENAMESIDLLAMHAALGGELVNRGGGTTRVLLESATATMNWTEANLWTAAAMIQDLKCPPYIDPMGGRNFIAIGHPDAYYDLFHAGNIVTAATYGYKTEEVIYNGEVGKLAGFKLIISPWAKVFGSAGVAHATSCGAATGYATTGYSLDGVTSFTTAAIIPALSKGLIVTTGTNVGSGRYLLIGASETSALTNAGTWYDTNERVRYVSGTTNMKIIGSGANGGLRFDHTCATTNVLNDDTVYPVAYGSPSSLVKVFANEIGEFGEIVGPLQDGLAEQWQSMAWKWYGGYGRVAENMILRGEYSSSLDTV